MNCENHPDREGVAACVSCGKVICADCRLKLAGKNYCQECADELVSEQKQPEENQQTTRRKPGMPLASDRISNRYQQDEYEPVQYERRSAQPRTRERVAKKGTNPLLLLCVAFIVVIIIIGVILYAAYVIYLAPHYGDIQNVIQILLNDPQRVLDYLNSQ